MPPAPHNVARAITSVITTVIWFFILWGTGHFFCVGNNSKLEHVTPLVLANVTWLTYLFIPYFVTENVLISSLDGVMKERVIVAEPEDPNARAENPWRASVINALRFGLVPGLIGGYIAYQANAESLTVWQFSLRYALAGAPLAGITAWIVGGEPFLKTLRVARAKRAWQGDPNTYLNTRFALPHGLVNFIINAILAFALAPKSLAEGGVVPGVQVVFDTAITGIVLALLMLGAVRTHARVEAQWGIAPEAAAGDSSVKGAFFRGVLVSIGAAVLVGVVLTVLHLKEISTYAWAVYRGVVFGVFCAWICKRIARGVLKATFQPSVDAATAAKPVVPAE